jgi:hypothetical protein
MGEISRLQVSTRITGINCFILYYYEELERQSFKMGMWQAVLLLQVPIQKITEETKMGGAKKANIHNL